MKSFSLLCLLLCASSLANAKVIFKDVIMEGPEQPNNCDTCKILMDEVERRLAFRHETIKLGSRLDDENKYKAKPYEESELRIIEIIEESCKVLDTVHQVDDPNDDSKKIWKVNPPRLTSTFTKQKGDDGMMLGNTKEGRIQCDNIVETWEEELQELIGQSDLTPAKRKRQFCYDASKSCEKKKKKKKKKKKAKKKAEETEAAAAAGADAAAKEEL